MCNMCTVPTETERGVTSPEAGVTGSFEPPGVDELRSSGTKQAFFN